VGVLEFETRPVPGAGAAQAAARVGEPGQLLEMSTIKYANVGRNPSPSAPYNYPIAFLTVSREDGETTVKPGRVEDSWKCG
jgi:hypothetical protein